MLPTLADKRSGESSNESRNNETTVINEKNIDDLIRQVFSMQIIVTLTPTLK